MSSSHRLLRQGGTFGVCGFLTTLFNYLFTAPADPSKKVMYGPESMDQPLVWCSHLCSAPVNVQVPLEGAALVCTLCPRLCSEPDQEGMH